MIRNCALTALVAGFAALSAPGASGQDLGLDTGLDLGGGVDTGLGLGDDGPDRAAYGDRRPLQEREDPLGDEALDDDPLSPTPFGEDRPADELGRDDQLVRGLGEADPLDEPLGPLTEEPPALISDGDRVLSDSIDPIEGDGGEIFDDPTFDEPDLVREGEGVLQD